MCGACERALHLFCFLFRAMNRAELTYQNMLLHIIMQSLRVGLWNTSNQHGAFLYFVNADFGSRRYLAEKMQHIRFAPVPRRNRDCLERGLFCFLSDMP